MFITCLIFFKGAFQCQRKLGRKKVYKYFKMNRATILANALRTTSRTCINHRASLFKPAARAMTVTSSLQHSNPVLQHRKLATRKKPQNMESEYDDLEDIREEIELPDKHDPTAEQVFSKRKYLSINYFVHDSVQ